VQKKDYVTAVKYIQKAVEHGKLKLVWILFYFFTFFTHLHLRNTERIYTDDFVRVNQCAYVRSFTWQRRAGFTEVS